MFWTWCVFKLETNSLLFYRLDYCTLNEIMRVFTSERDWSRSWTSTLIWKQFCPCPHTCTCSLVCRSMKDLPVQDQKKSVLKPANAPVWMCLRWSFSICWQLRGCGIRTPQTGQGKASWLVCDWAHHVQHPQWGTERTGAACLHTLLLEDGIYKGVDVNGTCIFIVANWFKRTSWHSSVSRQKAILGFLDVLEKSSMWNIVHHYENPEINFVKAREGHHHLHRPVFNLIMPSFNFSIEN